MNSNLLALAVTIFVFVVSSFPCLLSTSSIYDALQSHGLPIGLFPKGITNFTIDPSTGRFEFHLQQSCDAKFESHVRYDLNVSGTLAMGQLGELSGIVAQDLFLWFPVKGIRVDIPSSGLIYFDVGVVFKQFSLSLFETPRDCTVSGLDMQITNMELLNDRSKLSQNQLEQLQYKFEKGDVQTAVS